MPLNLGSKQGEVFLVFFVFFVFFVFLVFLVFRWIIFLFFFCGLNLFFQFFCFFCFFVCASISRYKGVNVSKPIQSATELFKSMMIKKRGFYRGLTPALLRAFPAHGSIFVGYEMTVKCLSVFRGESEF